MAHSEALICGNCGFQFVECLDDGWELGRTTDFELRNRHGLMKGQKKPGGAYVTDIVCPNCRDVCMIFRADDSGRPSKDRIRMNRILKEYQEKLNKSGRGDKIVFDLLPSGGPDPMPLTMPYFDWSDPKIARQFRKGKNYYERMDLEDASWEESFQVVDARRTLVELLARIFRTYSLLELSYIIRKPKAAIQDKIAAIKSRRLQLAGPLRIAYRLMRAAEKDI
jgi:hypothetical protein